MIEIGKSYRFDYPTEFVSLPEYTEHAQQTVTVMRELEDGKEYDREDGDIMYEIVADDKWIGQAYAHELISTVTA